MRGDGWGDNDRGRRQGLDDEGDEKTSNSRQPEPKPQKPGGAVRRGVAGADETSHASPIEVEGWERA